MHKILIVFISLTVIVFIILTIVRIVMALFFLYMIRKYEALIKMIRPKDKKEKPYIPSSRNDIMYRDKDVEKQKARENAIKLQNVQRLPRIGDQDIDLDPDFDKKEIVGMVKPVGRWTAMILGQKVSYLMQHAETLKTQNDAGYWVNMMHAKDASQGKGRGV